MLAIKQSLPLLFRFRSCAVLCLFLFCFLRPTVQGQQIAPQQTTDEPGSGSRARAAEEAVPNSLLPIQGSTISHGREEDGIQWRPLVAQSFRFLLLQHGFRYATEEGTRRPHASLVGGYA